MRLPAAPATLPAAPVVAWWALAPAAARLAFAPAAGRWAPPAVPRRTPPATRWALAAAPSRPAPSRAAPSHPDDPLAAGIAVLRAEIARVHRTGLLGLLPVLLGAAMATARTATAHSTRVEPAGPGAEDVHPFTDGPADGLGLPDPRGEADLVGRATRGEREAFGLIYDRYAEFIYRYAYYRVGGNRAVAEDVVSETFLRALTRISTFEWQGRDIGAWLVTIARNHIVDLARSGRARLEFPTADLLAAADGRPGAGAAVPGPEDAVLAALDVREVLDALGTLGPEQRECVTLRFLEGLSVRETARAMNKKEGAVRALQLRAVRALARHLPMARTD
ncbi:sigma-70 family RNA polymerase sigma factor [Parafrankia discariae]|uniref:sigma-70 family RNA polymerase sigma factor n=1 Tax=Parafrankia discariae TaxID=365528 RepID=UPI0003804D8D|nr:sigma-70 family RNA polymerase sigma factor [Parafrankia discariae]